ncbi:RagB/SusD family nutrient uptake outer membrane protein [Pedobacter psychroterrae]|uniref:RagB/SusD family nutrient uptake outer membrane protein n=1 Tax=Pedobacter psychroterrae TaxID=2530453 RepID=A0A4R0NQ08_9SPHI|nr:RagB/SusD family nutrient uptake outer membrane protein [Pedobacter psychroterrae]TCD01325.1 RagB/SusD family nutrient uptake outer membrane protein [Pedobacter psychroterrae]
MKKIVLMSLIFFSLLAGSCNKALEINSTRVVSEENFWNTLEDSRAALVGVYGLTRSAMADNNGHWLYGDVRMGTFDSPIRQDLKAIINNDLNAQYPVVESLSNWRKFYAIINAANIFLERIGEVKANDKRYTESNMVVDVAQIRFLRAFAYFYMVRIWGDVPFVTSSRDGSFENKPKTNGKAILEFVQQEMETAIQDLPYLYSANDIQQPGLYYNESRSRWDGTLVRKLSAYAVLAHVCAWQGKYGDVSVYTKIVLDNISRGSINYITTDFLTSRNGFFFDKRNEHLLAFAFVFGHQDATFVGNLESLTLAQPIVNKSLPDIFVPKDSILSIFKEVGDARFNIDTVGVTHSERYFTNFQGKYPIFSKVKVMQGGSSDPTFRIYSSAVVFTRLEDITLLRAEALAVLGERDGAITALNTVRQRRYNVDNVGQATNNNAFVAYSEAKSGLLIDAIFRERQKELMGEGHRWYDQVRYHKIKGDAKWTAMINSGEIYWPISREILNQNSLLTQNSYWK